MTKDLAISPLNIQLMEIGGNVRWEKTIKHQCIPFQDELTHCRDGNYYFPQLELTQDSGFTSRIKTYHKNTHLFLSKQLDEKAW